jgi:hypothetical protein
MSEKFKAEGRAVRKRDRVAYESCRDVDAPHMLYRLTMKFTYISGMLCHVYLDGRYEARAV